MNADPPERSRHFRGTERVNEFHCRYPCHASRVTWLLSFGPSDGAVSVTLIDPKIACDLGYFLITANVSRDGQIDYRI